MEKRRHKCQGGIGKTLAKISQVVHSIQRAYEKLLKPSLGDFGSHVQPSPIILQDFKSALKEKLEPFKNEHSET